jgi:hypothetical protein
MPLPATDAVAGSESVDLGPISQTLNIPHLRDRVLSVELIAGCLKCLQSVTATL